MVRKGIMLARATGAGAVGVLAVVVGAASVVSFVFGFSDPTGWLLMFGVVGVVYTALLALLARWIWRDRLWAWIMAAVLTVGQLSAIGQRTDDATWIGPLAWAWSFLLALAIAVRTVSAQLVGRRRGVSDGNSHR